MSSRGPVLRIRALLPDFRRLSLLHIMPHGHAEPAEPDDASHDPISNLATGCVVSELEAQTSLDDGESQENTTPPDVEGGPDGSPLLTNKDGMMEGTEGGLEEEAGDDGETDDRVVFVELGHSVSIHYFIGQTAEYQVPMTVFRLWSARVRHRCLSPSPPMP